MAKSNTIEAMGTVIDAQPNAMFKVRLDNDFEILAHISGKIRMNYIRILPGDRVKVERICKAYVRQVQSHQETRSRNGYLRKP